jgi:hypothetical protein
MPRILGPKLAALAAAATAVRCAGAAEAAVRAAGRVAAASAVSAAPITPEGSAVLRPIGIVRAAPNILRSGESCGGARPEHEQRYAQGSLPAAPRRQRRVSAFALRNPCNRHSGVTTMQPRSSFPTGSPQAVIISCRPASVNLPQKAGPIRVRTRALLSRAAARGERSGRRRAADNGNVENLA